MMPTMSPTLLLLAALLASLLGIVTCQQECVDKSDDLQALLGFRCDATDLECDGITSAFCPVTCDACLPGCVDRSSDLVEQGLLACGDASHLCSNYPMSPVYQFYCPDTCGSCTPWECADTEGEIASGMSCGHPDLPCDGFIGAKCPQSCGLCDLCYDRSTIMIQGGVPPCSVIESQCHGSEFSHTYQVLCPVTCGRCIPEEVESWACQDYDEIDCRRASEQSLCSGSLYQALCPETCSTCDARTCINNNVFESGSFGVTSCAEVTNCDDELYGTVFRHFCPETCDTCPPSMTATISRSPTASLSKQASPSKTSSHTPTSTPSTSLTASKTPAESVSSSTSASISMSPSASPEEVAASSSSSDNSGVVAGAVIGTIGVACAVLFVVWKRNKSKHNGGEDRQRVKGMEYDNEL